MCCVCMLCQGCPVALLNCDDLCIRVTERTKQHTSSDSTRSMAWLAATRKVSFGVNTSGTMSTSLNDSALGVGQRRGDSCTWQPLTWGHAYRQQIFHNNNHAQQYSQHASIPARTYTIHNLPYVMPKAWSSVEATGVCSTRMGCPS